jgi:hypothetical protein
MLYSAFTARKRLKILKQNLAPTTAARSQELAAKYASLKTAARGKKTEAWLRQWLEVIRECKEVEIQEVSSTRPQEDFCLAIRAIDTEYSISALRDLLKAKREGTKIASIEDYISDFTTYLRRVFPLNSGLGAYGADFDAASSFEPPPKPESSSSSNKGSRRKYIPKCLCGKLEYWSDCPYCNPKIRTTSWKPDPAIQRQVNKALKDPELREKVERAIERSNNRKSKGKGPLDSFDDGKPPQNNEHSSCAAQIVTMSTHPAGMEDRWIVDPGSNTHIINSESWIRWEREYEEVNNRTVGAGREQVAIEAWGSITLIVDTPSGKKPIKLTHVAYVPGFLTSVFGVARCRAVGIHFDSGRDALYKGSYRNIVVNLEYQRGHWYIDSDASRRPSKLQISSFASSYRPSKDEPKPRTITAQQAHQIWGHPGIKQIEELPNHVDRIQLNGSASRDKVCKICVLTKITKQVSRRPPHDKATRPFYWISIDLVQILKTGEACLNRGR